MLQLNGAQGMNSVIKGTVRGLPISPVLPHSFLSLPILWRSFPTLSDHFQPRAIFSIGDIPSQIIAEGRIASCGLVTAAFQIWEAWYYTWSLVYTHSADTLKTG